MMTAPRMLATISTLAVSAAGLIALSPAAALAAPCSGAGCSTQDPYALSCTAASSITRTYQSGSAIATIVNEYSSLCNANWVFAYENTAAQQAGWSLYLEIQTSYTANGGTITQTMCSPDPIVETDTDSADVTELCRGTYGGQNGWPMWTDMVDGTNKAYGELEVFNSNGTKLATVPDAQ